LENKMYISKSKPCPFCGSKDLSFRMNQGDKWGFVVCNTCAAQGPEVRTSYDDSENAPWHNDAIEEWNKRVDDG